MNLWPVIRKSSWAIQSLFAASFWQNFFQTGIIMDICFFWWGNWRMTHHTSALTASAVFLVDHQASIAESWHLTKPCGISTQQKISHDFLLSLIHISKSFFKKYDIHIYTRIYIYMYVYFNWIFHYKPSILGYPYFWKHPYVNDYKCQNVW